MKEKKFCVVIPAHKQMAAYEKLAYAKIHSTLVDKTNVYLLCPSELDTSEYESMFPEIKVKRIDGKWFKSLDSYNSMCVSKWFYEMFSEYEYMLICQLDVWLNKDDILEWCKKGYDYIGAPIVVSTARWHNYRIDTDGNVIITPAVGNGGFSLRKISTFIEITDLDSYLFKRYNITKEVIDNIKFEDLWFCDELSKYYDLERPNYKEAFKFAIDMNPDLVETQYNVTELPTAIHAFDKNIPYWRTKIKELDNNDIYEECYMKHKDFIDVYYYKKGQQN